MRVAAGQKNRKIGFYPRSTSEDSLGVETEVDGSVIYAWAKVLFGTGSERREAGQAGAQQTATFRTLSSAALRAADELWEIDFDGARWGITSIAPTGEAEDIEFTATKKGS